MNSQTAFTAYDTLCSVRILAAGTESGIPALLSEAERIARELERTLSMFDETSELSRLCRGYTPGVPVPVSPLVQEFLSCNLEIASHSGGAFDPTVGPLVRLWNFLSEEPQVPEPAALDAARARVGYRHIVLDKAHGTVSMNIPGMVIDPGASGKGLSLGLVADALRAGGVTQAVLDFGGNLYVVGGKRDPQSGRLGPWQVGIRDPDNTHGAIGTIPLFDAGIATSSWYEHCFCKDGKIYHHLLDPRTGAPMPLTLKSVSIVSSRAVYTDLLSTAFFILGEELGRGLVEALRTQSGERIEYVAVRKDGTVSTSEHAGFFAK